ncbi:hypothetical protein T439DRAFT_315845 [Meredithblackwellia eburnea MCA 4105]
MMMMNATVERLATISPRAQYVALSLAVSFVVQVSYYYALCHWLFPRAKRTTGNNASVGAPAGKEDVDEEKEREREREREREKQERKKIVRARAWVLTTLSSSVMTLAALPFLVDFLRFGLDVALVARREHLARAVSAFFVVYLVLDLVFGLLHYRSQMNLLTGWVHHSAYTVLVSFIIYRDFCHVFALAAFMELPTFILALAMIAPATRSDVFFSVVFFLTRILYHIALIVSYITPYGRTYGCQLFSAVDGTPIASFVPAGALLAAAPLHISWFTNSIKGQIRRRRQAQKAMATAAAEAEAAESESAAREARKSRVPPLSPYLLPSRSQLTSATSYFTSRIIPSLALDAPLRSTSPRRPVRDFFANNKRDERDVLRVVGNTPAGVRLRVGLRGEELKRFGGRMRRRIVGSITGDLQNDLLPPAPPLVPIPVA